MWCVKEEVEPRMARMTRIQGDKSWMMQSLWNWAAPVDEDVGNDKSPHPSPLPVGRGEGGRRPGEGVAHGTREFSLRPYPPEFGPPLPNPLLLRTEHYPQLSEGILESQRDC